MVFLSMTGVVQKLVAYVPWIPEGSRGFLLDAQASPVSPRAVACR